MNSSIQITFALSIGSDLVREGHVRRQLQQTTIPATGQSIYGALIVSCANVEVLDERYWDQLDSLLTRLVSAVQRVGPSNPQRFSLDDTKIECVVTADTNDEISVQFEDELPVTAPRNEWVRELAGCCERLTTLLAVHSLPIPPTLGQIGNDGATT